MNFLRVAVIFLWATLTSHAQGTINLGNGITATRFPIYNIPISGSYEAGNGPLSNPTGSTVYTGGLLSGTRYAIEFWAGPAYATDFSGLTLITTTTFRTGANPALLPNGITLTTTNAVPGVTAGFQAKLGVRVWDTQSSATYANASVRAQSTTLFLSGPLGGVDGGGNLFLNPNWVGQSFSFSIPEPSALSLVALGAISLRIFRPRKSA